MLFNRAKAPKRIGVRLTTWYAVVLLATVILFSIFLYYRLSHDLHKQHDYFLVLQLRDFAGDVARNTSNLAELKKDLDDEIPAGREKDIVYRLCNVDGNTLLQSKLFPSYSTSRSIHPALEKPLAAVTPWTAESSKRGAYRMTAQAVSGPDGSVFIIESGYSLRHLNATLSHYRRNFFIFLLPLVCVGIIGGWWLARKSLAPIERMAAAARAVTSESLGTRIPSQEKGDELGQLAAVLNDMLERLEEAFQRIEKFSGDMAHELRTPLTVLKGEAERALVSNASADELRAVIAAQAEMFERLNALINDLLLLARKGTRGSAEHDVIPIDLADCIREAVETFAPIAEDCGIALELVPLSSCRVRGSNAALNRAFSNIIDNALKYTPRGGKVNIEINGNIIKIRDTGRGIAPEDLPHVFERFYRAKSSGGSSGFGLGLSICKQIIEEHRGIIAISSNQAEGTEVRIQLPPAESS